MGIDFQVRPADIDETVKKGEQPGDYVMRLSQEKALAISRFEPEAIVIGSDTSVVIDSRILGKPGSEEEAVNTLQALSARTHQVVTGLAVAVDGYAEARLITTDVIFRALRQDEIFAYVRSGEPMDKAGSYGIQGLGGIFVESLQGSYSAVVGLPLRETADLLAQAGYPVWTAWQSGQESLNE
jgi:septum formation protein